MLAKIWKKLLLAICIIACLFNITAKLVNRISLERVISSQQEGVNVRELLNITEKQTVVTPSTNTVSKYNVVNSNTTVTNNVPEVSEENNDVVQEEQPTENVEENNDESNSGGIFDKLFDNDLFEGVKDVM